MAELNHVGVVGGDEKETVSFYRDLLGFEKTREFVVPEKLSEQLFPGAGEMKVLVFEKEGSKIEVFIVADSSPHAPNIHHIGLLVDDLPALLRSAAEMGVSVISGSHQGKTVYFLKDRWGNMIEVKGR